MFAAMWLMGYKSHLLDIGIVLLLFSRLIMSASSSLLHSPVGNTRVVGQKELEFFRGELESRLSNNYNVILKGTKLPMSLLTDHQKVKQQAC